MKHIYLFLIGLLLFPIILSAKNTTEKCRWSSLIIMNTPSQLSKCGDGETYIYGIQTCGEKFKKNAFCHSKFSDSLEECANNFKSVETQKCFQKYIAPTLEAKYYQNKKYDGSCFWGWGGGEEYKCGQDTYLFGRASCKSGIYKNIFCKYQHASSGKNCAQDKHPDTIACYNKFVKELHPELVGVKPAFTPKGAR